MPPSSPSLTRPNATDWGHGLVCVRCSEEEAFLNTVAVIEGHSVSTGPASKKAGGWAPAFTRAQSGPEGTTVTPPGTSFNGYESFTAAVSALWGGIGGALPVRGEPRVSAGMSLPNAQAAGVLFVFDDLASPSSASLSDEKVRWWWVRGMGVWGVAVWVVGVCSGGRGACVRPACAVGSGV